LIDGLRRRKVQGGLWNEERVEEVLSEKIKAIFVSFHPILLAYNIVRVTDGILQYITGLEVIVSPLLHPKTSGGLEVAYSGRQQIPFKPPFATVH